MQEHFKNNSLKTHSFKDFPRTTEEKEKKIRKQVEKTGQKRTGA